MQTIGKFKCVIHINQFYTGKENPNQSKGKTSYYCISTFQHTNQVGANAKLRAIPRNVLCTPLVSEAPVVGLFFLGWLFLYRHSSAMMLVFHLRPVLDHWGTFCAGGLPNVHFRCCHRWDLNPNSCHANNKCQRLNDIRHSHPQLII